MSPVQRNIKLNDIDDREMTLLLSVYLLKGKEKSEKKICGGIT